MDPYDPSVTEALRAWNAQHEAGVSAGIALATSAQIARAGRARASFLQASERAREGETIERVLEALSRWLSDDERAVMAAGWNSGRAERSFESVVAGRELRYEARRKVRAGLILPTLLILVASFVAPLPGWFRDGSLERYLRSAFVPIGVFLAVVGAIGFLMEWRARRRRRGGPDGEPAPPGLFDRLLLHGPFVSRGERDRNVGAFAQVLAQLVGAGLPATQAMERTARTLPNGIYRLEVWRALQEVRKGSPLHRALREGPLWPPELLAVLRVGEESGSLDTALERAGRLARERFERRVAAGAAWLPRLIYAGVSLYIIYQIFQLYGQYSSMMGGIG